MYKLEINISQPANYIYHMLSVSNVGYDNSYGQKYKFLHDMEDLIILKKNEVDLTVAGGEHCGRLYGLLVAKPASSSDLSSLSRYLESIIYLFTSKNPQETARIYFDLDKSFLDFGLKSFEEVFEFCLKAFDNYSNVIIRISVVLLKNIKVYEDNVWDFEKQILLDYQAKLTKEIEGKYNLVSSWEFQLDEKLKIDKFEVILVNSIEDGAQGIDISNTKDVFNINDNLKSLIGFISHEIGIYIIFQSLPLTMKENMSKYWLCIESLATYHNQKVLYENENLFAKDNKYLKKFDEIYKENQFKSFLSIIEQAIN